MHKYKKGEVFGSIDWLKRRGTKREGAPKHFHSKKQTKTTNHHLQGDLFRFALQQGAEHSGI